MHNRVYEDTLIIVWVSPYNTKHAKLKRVAKNCPLSSEERTKYRELLGNAARMVAYLRDTRKLSLRESLDLLNSARGGSPLVKNSAAARYRRARVYAMMGA